MMYDWSGAVLLRANLLSGDAGIIACTDQYLALSHTTGVIRVKTELQVFRTRDGSRVLTARALSAVNLSQMFCSPNDTVLTTIKTFSWSSQSAFSPPTHDILFAGTRIRSSVEASGGVIDVLPAA